MKLLIIIIAICALPTLTYCQNEETQYKVDTILANCLKENVTTVGMTDCFVSAQNLWDKELNKYYQLLLTKLDATGQKKLKVTQKQWIIFRDQEIKFISETYGNRDGTMWIIIVAEKINQLIRQRAVDLIGYYETLPENSN
jgi:uncharacterized protein YecT (DUF1311 family)